MNFKEANNRWTRPVNFLSVSFALIAIVSIPLFRRASEPTSAPPDLAEQAQQDLDKRHYQPLSGSLQALLDDEKHKSIPTQTHPLLYREAPDFTLHDTNQQPFTLREAQQNGPVVVVFYYGYYCDHCVSQLFALNKDWNHFRELGATIVAISADPTELTRERFQKYGAFLFPVLTDPNNTIATAYGTFVPTKNPKDKGDLLHGTFVINRKQQIVWANRGDGPFIDNQTLLRVLHEHR